MYPTFEIKILDLMYEQETVTFEMFREETPKKLSRQQSLHFAGHPNVTVLQVLLAIIAEPVNN